MNRLSLSLRDQKNLHTIALAMFNGVEGINPVNKHKLIDLFCQAAGYRNLHDVQAELRNGDPAMPALGSITLHDLRLVLARGLQRVVSKMSGDKRSLDLLKAYQQIVRADLEPLSIYKATVEHLHTQKLITTNAGRSVLTELARATARRQAEIERCWTPDRGQLSALGAPPYLLAISYDPALPTSTATVHHWPTAKGLFSAALAATTDRDFAPTENAEKLDDPDYKSLFMERAVVQGTYMAIDDFVTHERIPYHEVMWLFSEEGEYIGRVLRHTVHGAVVAGLLHTDADVREGKSCLLLNKPLTLIHNRHYEFLEEHGTLPVFTLKKGYPKPPSVRTLQDRPLVPAEHLVRVPNIRAGYMLMSNLGGTRIDKKAWQINGRSIAVYPERASNRRWGVHYLETERWLEEADLPELFSEPKPVDHYDLGRIGTANDPRTFLSTYNTGLQGRATLLLNSELNKYAKLAKEELLSGGLLNRIGADRDLALTMESQAETDYANSCRAEDIHHTQAIDSYASALKAYDQRFTTFGPYTIWHARNISGAGTDATAATETLPLTLTYLAGVSAAETSAKQVSTDILLYAVGRWLAGGIDLHDVPAIASQFEAVKHKLEAQAERVAAVKTYVQEVKELGQAAEAEGYAYLYGPVPVIEPENLKLLKGL